MCGNSELVWREGSFYVVGFELCCHSEDFILGGDHVKGGNSCNDELGRRMGATSWGRSRGCAIASSEPPGGQTSPRDVHPDHVNGTGASRVRSRGRRAAPSTWTSITTVSGINRVSYSVNGSPAPGKNGSGSKASGAGSMKAWKSEEMTGALLSGALEGEDEVNSTVYRGINERVVSGFRSRKFKFGGFRIPQSQV